MDPNLERLIRLQDLDNRMEQARRSISEVPGRSEALDVRLDERNQALATARQKLADTQTERRNIEKELAIVQGRLSKYRDQLMAVKTNKEYTAMQKEIATAEREVRTFEDRILELMLDSDDGTSQVKEAERGLSDEQRAVAADREALERERDGLEKDIEATGTLRRQLASEIEAKALALFEHVARGRKGVAVVAARDGICTYCHVRLRPQMFNEVRRGDNMIQCDSCQRILYFSPAAQPQPS